jgi:hypothetical protein
MKSYHPLRQIVRCELTRTASGIPSTWVLQLSCGCVVCRSAHGSSTSVRTPPMRCRCELQQHKCRRWRPPVGIGSDACEVQP